MKKILICLCVVFIVVFSVSTVNAASWLELAQDENYISSIDISSVEESDGVFRLWYKMLFRSDKKKKEIRNAFELDDIPDYIVYYLEFVLEKPLCRKLQSAAFNKKGEFLLFIQEEADNEYTPIIPDSHSEILWLVGKKLLGYE